ncbi:MAG: SBBP repeat-containing protein [Planctomycetes bacterium]|nr:SBBP repeat-containing protein [Planctomycetota bacterium]
MTLINNGILAGGVVFVVAMCLSFFPNFPGKQVETPSPHQANEVIQKAQGIQLPFIKNEEQMDEEVAFFTNTFQGGVFVTKRGELVYSLFAAENRVKRVVLKEEFIDGKVANITGEGKTITEVSCFKGSDPARWKSNISAYDVVSLGEVYRGIELKLKAYGNNVEKLFYVKPDAGTEQIKIGLSGAKALRVNKEGQLEAETGLGTVRFTNPVAYQEMDGKRVEVAVEYRVLDGGGQEAEEQGIRGAGETGALNYGFKVAAYDTTKELVIDPLLASTYLGGLDSDYGYAIAIDADKNILVAGYTTSSDFPITSGAWGITYNNNDIFISKFSGDLKHLLASTLIGGSSDDYVRAMVIDTAKNIYIAGQTSSSNYPVTRDAYTVTKHGGSDVFLTKLDGNLTRLIASTFLGGSSDDYAQSIVLAKSGIFLYVTGGTSSLDFPTTPGAYSSSHKDADAFVAKLNSNLSLLLASTYLGGDNKDYGISVCLDVANNVIVCGDTCSPDFPIASGAYDETFNGGFGDVFIAKLNPDLSKLLASTYLGGASDDLAHGSTIDSQGNIYVTGQTESLDFPATPNAYSTSFRNGDVFVSKFNWNLTELAASTYLGGADDDAGNSVVIGPDGKIYVGGYTGSTDFPTTPGAYCTTKGAFFDAFAVKLSTDLSKLLASTFIGGFYRDAAHSITTDPQGNVYVVGETRSADFPVTPGAFDSGYNGDAAGAYTYDAFISKLDNTLSASPVAGDKR